jgi:hypothetical protein
MSDNEKTMILTLKLDFIQGDTNVLIKSVIDDLQNLEHIVEVHSINIV